MIFRKEHVFCAVCGKQIQHRHKPMDQWGIDGFLCGDCHMDKMREYYVEGIVPKKKLVKCDLCGKEVDPKDANEPHRGLNLKGKICKECFEDKQEEVQKKFNYCAVCGKKLGFFRYNPKSKWKMDGQLCRKCWDSENMRQ